MPSPRGASCTVGGFDRAAGKSAQGGFTLAHCLRRWALAAGPNELDLFRLRRGRWTSASTGAGDEIVGASPLEFATAGIGPALLEELAQPLGRSAWELADRRGLGRRAGRAGRARGQA